MCKLLVARKQLIAHCLLAAAVRSSAMLLLLESVRLAVNLHSGHRPKDPWPLADCASVGGRPHRDQQLKGRLPRPATLAAAAAVSASWLQAGSKQQQAVRVDAYGIVMQQQTHQERRNRGLCRLYLVVSAVQRAAPPQGLASADRSPADGCDL